MVICRLPEGDTTAPSVALNETLFCATGATPPASMSGTDKRYSSVERR